MHVSKFDRAASFRSHSFSKPGGISAQPLISVTTSNVAANLKALTWVPQFPADLREPSLNCACLPNALGRACVVRRASRSIAVTAVTVASAQTIAAPVGMSENADPKSPST